MDLDLINFTDRQKMFFFKIQTMSLIKILKKKNRTILELQQENEDFVLKRRELERSLEKKNEIIKRQKRQLKSLTT